MNQITEFDVENMSEEQVRDFARRLVIALDLAEDDGMFGKDSWEGYLEIEV